MRDDEKEREGGRERQIDRHTGGGGGGGGGPPSDVFREDLFTQAKRCLTQLHMQLPF